VSFGEPGHVLLVEDNPTIALDTEAWLFSLGAKKVMLASSADAALALIEGLVPDFALLDFNLGSETSEPVARVLDGLSVRFAFATGYGDIARLAIGYSHVVGVLEKPYSQAELARLIARTAG
jgi:CheY-like chemotaxis protein